MNHQELALLPGLSVAENVLLGRQPRNGWIIDHAATRARAQDLVDRVGLDVDVTTRLGRLSVAQRQLVDIAKTLSLDARLLILDSRPPRWAARTPSSCSP